MATEWQGKSRGTVLGYKIFIFFMRNLGVGAAYTLLYFVALYFCFFSPKSTTWVYYYFRKRFGLSKSKSLFQIYRNYYIFGQTIIDKIAISSGLRNRFSYEFDGVEHLNEMIGKQQGGILISAHVGNFEIADFFFDELEGKNQIHLVTTDAEHRNIKDYLETIISKSSIKFIIVKDDLSHIFDINNALSKGEIVCFTGDRYFECQKTMSAKLLGKEAAFPAGPFLLASRLKVPVLFVYVMKEKRFHYHLYARKANSKHRDAQGLLENYTMSVEWMLKKYPRQWFNFYDFWNVKSHP